MVLKYTVHQVCFLSETSETTVKPVALYMLENTLPYCIERHVATTTTTPTLSAYLPSRGAPTVNVSSFGVETIIKNLLRFFSNLLASKCKIYFLM